MKRIYRSSVLMVVVGLIVLGLAAQVSALPNLTAAQKVQNAWQLAQDSGVYHFNTEIVQTTYPAPALMNVGRTSRAEAVPVNSCAPIPNWPRITGVHSYWVVTSMVVEPMDWALLTREGSTWMGYWDQKVRDTGKGRR